MRKCPNFARPQTLPILNLVDDSVMLPPTLNLEEQLSVRNVTEVGYGQQLFSTECRAKFGDVQ